MTLAKCISVHQTANDRQQTADGRRQTADGRQETSDSRWQRGDERHSDLVQMRERAVVDGHVDAPLVLFLENYVRGLLV
jgi:hypothetical protein